MGSDENDTMRETVLRGGAELFKGVFTVYAGLLVFIFLLVELGFRYSSFLQSMTAFDIAVNTAGMALLMMLIAAGAALGVVTFALPVRLVAGPRAYRWAYQAFILLFLLIFGSYFYYFLKGRVLVAFSYWLPLFFDVILFLAFAALILFRRKQFLQRFKSFSAAARIPLLSCALISVCLIGWRVVSVESKPGSSDQEQKVPVTAKRQPNVILVTFDALPAEELSLYGYRLRTTPNLDEFARECSVFENAISTSNWTKPTIGSLLTGKYPTHHHLINRGYYHTNTNPKPEESLPALLKKSGYRSVALVANTGYAHPYVNGLAPYFDKKGFDYAALQNFPLRWRIATLCFSMGHIAYRYNIETFNWFAQILVEAEAGSVRSVLLNNFEFNLIDIMHPFNPPEMVFNDAENYLSDESIQADARPLFIWLHVFNPHDPYLPPPPFKEKFLKGNELDNYDSLQLYMSRRYEAREQPAIDKLRLRYDENLLYTDARFGDFLAFLRGTNRLTDSIIIVSSDHGESFSHGRTAHGGGLLYNQLVRIPLLIRLPNQKAGRRIPGVVSQTDITPTILDLLGKPNPSWADGISLKPCLAGKEMPQRPVFTMDLVTKSSSATKGNLAVVLGNYKYVRSVEGASRELYDNSHDPGEVNNLVSVLPDKANQLDKLLMDGFRTDGRMQGL